MESTRIEDRSKYRRRRENLAMLGLCSLLVGTFLGCTTHPQATTAPTSATSPTPPLRTAAVRVEPQREWAEAILYFVVVDRFADGDPTNNQGVQRGQKGTFHGGDLAGLTSRLDDLADLGVTALWITPVVKNIDGFVTGAGFPDWGYHGYWADDFYALDPRFGSEEDLATLVAAAHERGMKVLLDVVYNHAGYGSQYTTNPRTRDWLRVEDRGTCGANDWTSCVAGLPDFKTEREEVADFLMTAHLGLARRVGLDGFRLDTVKHVDHPFWQEHRRRTREELGQDFFLVGEVWGGDPQVLDPWFSGDEMDAGFDFSFQGSTIGFVSGRGRPAAYDRYLESRETVREGYLLAHYLASHDVPGGLFQLDGDLARFRLAVLLQMTSRGIPTIYYGEEVGRIGGDWPANRSDMPWGDLGIQPGAGLPRNEALREHYQRLIAIRRAHPALWRGSHEGLIDRKEQDLLIFARRDEATGEEVVVAVNRAEEPRTARFPLPDAWKGGEIQDLWRGATVTVSATTIEVEIPGLEAGIYAVAPKPAPG